MVLEPESRIPLDVLIVVSLVTVFSETNSDRASYFKRNHFDTYLNFSTFTCNRRELSIFLLSCFIL